MRKKIIVDSLSKCFNDTQSETSVLKSISFEVYDGEFFSILGSSGCGKTTLLRLLIGLLSPDSGRIIKDDVDITSFKPHERNMGIVFQNYALFENMTALENVEYAMRIHKNTKASARARATEMLEAVNMIDFADKKPRSLSGGQQQRVAIARTLALNPDVILFDEPMSALDVSTRLQLRKELKSIQNKFGTTMIYVTHDQEEAFSLSNRILVMNSGNIEMLDTPSNICSKPASEFVKRFVVDNLREKVQSISTFL